MVLTVVLLDLALSGVKWLNDGLLVQHNPNITTELKGCILALLIWYLCKLHGNKMFMSKLQISGHLTVSIKFSR